MLNKKKMAGRVPLENVSEEKRKQNGRTRFGRRLLISEITRLQKKNLPGERYRLKLTNGRFLKQQHATK
jgi:hypothetical protein